MSSEASIQQYLAEGLVALLPVYRGNVEGTAVFTLKQTYQAYHSLAWTLKLLARFCCLDLTSLRRRSGAQLGIRHHIPLPFSQGLVLLPVKVREGATLGETTVGYINLLHIEGIAETCPTGADSTAAASSEVPVRNGGDQANCRSRINCHGPIIIHSLNTASTLKQKLRQGETIREEILNRHKLLAPQEHSFCGLSREALRQLLPSCDCLLRSIMLLLLNSAEKE